MLTDPLFYLVAVPAVLLFGIAKGGFGGPMAVFSVPLMSLYISPTLAAAVLLPILVVMDMLVVKAYWGVFDRRALILLLPGALVGVAVGYFTAGLMNDDAMRVLVGAISLLFGLQTLLRPPFRASREHRPVPAVLFGGVAGYTSFAIHAGGPPLTMYLMPKGLSPLLYAGTAGIFFAVVNLAKLPPYYALGQLGSGNLLLSLVLMPLAPVGVWIGHWLVRRSGTEIYYRIISVLLVALGAYLLYQGGSGLF